MSAWEWCEEGGLYVNGDNFMMAPARTTSSGLLKISETRDKNSIHTTGWRTVDGHPGETSGWPGCMEKRHDILRKASPRLKETEEYFMPGSLPVQPQVTMGSGLVDPSGDSGWDGASRCRTTVGLDEHRIVVRGTLRKTMFRSSCSQTLWSTRT